MTKPPVTSAEGQPVLEQALRSFAEIKHGFEVNKSRECHTNTYYSTLFSRHSPYTDLSTLFSISYFFFFSDIDVCSPASKWTKSGSRQISPRISCSFISYSILMYACEQYLAISSFPMNQWSCNLLFHLYHWTCASNIPPIRRSYTLSFSLLPFSLTPPPSFPL